MKISPDHEDFYQPLLPWLAKAFEMAGADVWIHGQDENLIRERQKGEPGQRRFVVEVKGFANLLHEFVHFVQVGYLADDHGIDYQQIPFDLRSPAGRNVMWQELTCCVISCAYLGGNQKQIEAWFAEQVGIQDVFYGFADQLNAFISQLREIVDLYACELESTLETAYAQTSQYLLQAGTPSSLVDPPKKLTFKKLWARYLDSMFSISICA